MLVVLTREVWGVSVTWVKVSVMTRCPWCVCVLEVLILWTRWCRAKPRRINSMHWLIWLPWQPLPWPLYDVNNSWRDKPSQTHTQTQSHTHTHLDTLIDTFTDTITDSWRVVADVSLLFQLQSHLVHQHCCLQHLDTGHSLTLQATRSCVCVCVCVCGTWYVSSSEWMFNNS